MRCHFEKQRLIIEKKNKFATFKWINKLKFDYISSFGQRFGGLDLNCRFAVGLIGKLEVNCDIVVIQFFC
jgi:hypothetical protein